MAKEIKMVLITDVAGLGKTGDTVTVTSDEQLEYFESKGWARPTEEVTPIAGTSDGPIAEGTILPLGATRQEIGTNIGSSPRGVPAGQPLKEEQRLSQDIDQGNQNLPVGDNAPAGEEGGYTPEADVSGTPATVQPAADTTDTSGDTGGDTGTAGKRSRR